VNSSRYDEQLLQAFVDGELDLKVQLEFEQRLRDDALLNAQVQSLRRLRSAVREGADYHAAPAALRMPWHAQDDAPAATAVAARWRGWQPLAAGLGLAMVLMLAVQLAWLQSSKDQRLLDDVVASHVRSTVGQHLVDLASSDHHTVKPWLASRLGFSPQVSERPSPSAVFLGGRVDYLDGRPVAALAYRHGQHVVNSFLWPTEAGDRAPRYAVERGFQIAHWSRGGMNHWVISDLNREEFGAVVRTLEADDGAR
jgi:anti-sigma factor RsiW